MRFTERPQNAHHVSLPSLLSFFFLPHLECVILVCLWAFVRKAQVYKGNEVTGRAPPGRVTLSRGTPAACARCLSRPHLGAWCPSSGASCATSQGASAARSPSRTPGSPPWPPSASTPQYGSKPSSAPSSPSPRAPKSGEKICARAGFAVRHSHSGGNAVQQLCPGPRFDKPSTCRSPLTAYAHMAYETLPTIKQTLYNFFKEAPAAQTASNQAGWQHARQDPDSKDARLGARPPWATPLHRT